jgi:LysM repeat protein
MPEVTLSLPAVLGLLAMFLVIGSGLTYFATRNTPGPTAVAEATITLTPSLTPTPSPSPSQAPPTSTHTPQPTATPQSYIVKSGDSCGSIAVAFGISIGSIIQINNLSTACFLSEGQQLFIPAPTPTATPFPTATLSGAEATLAACEQVVYKVETGKTMSHIVALYNVPAEAIREWNGLVNDTIREGQELVIPLCRRAATPGPTPTATLPPPYEAPALLLPADGAPFTPADNSVTLQWAAVGTLRQDESYEVTVIDITDGGSRRLVERVTDTKLIVPTSFRPNDGRAHVIRWSVTTIRQTGTADDGSAIWAPAGEPSDYRDFTWYGTGSPTRTPSP